MPVSGNEEQGIKDILAFLPSPGLPALLLTITNGIIKTDDSQEAVKLIVKYCKDSLDVLKRKKVTKDVLFRYLRNANVEISPKADKTEMVQKCLQLWIPQTSPPTAMELMEYKDWEMADLDNDYVVSNPRPLSPGRLNDMGKTFIGWFYDLLKNVDDPNTFGPQHFWPDCTLIINQVDPSDSQSILNSACTGADSVCSFIRQELAKSSIIFVPNVYLDPRTILNSAGLVTIEIEGVVHRFSTPIGVFTHIFGLINDPSADDSCWKIKCIQMLHKVVIRNTFFNLSDL